MIDLDDFEAMVFSQRPAEQPWAPVTDYSFEARKEIEGQHPKLIKDVFQPELVVDAGCGPSAIFAQLLAHEGVSGYAFDTRLKDSWCRDDRWFERILTLDADMKPQATWDVFRASLTNAMGWFPLQQGQCDLVICREVLEHLTLLGIRQAVSNLCRLSSKYVYVTTRFSSEHALLHVETKDDLDPTHITIPSKDLLRLLFVLEGFRRRADLEERMDWQQKGRVLVYERAV